MSVDGKERRELAGGTHAFADTAEPKRPFTEEIRSTRSLMHKWRAIALLAAGAVMLSLGMWMLHG